LRDFACAGDKRFPETMVLRSLAEQYALPQKVVQEIRALEESVR
jgi:hypothetical protein